MMTVRFLTDCIDKYTGESYNAGTTKTVSDKRGAEMLLSSSVEEVKPVQIATEIEAKPKRKSTRKKKEE